MVLAKREKLYMEDQPVENTQNEPLRDKMVESREMGYETQGTATRSHVHMYSLKKGNGCFTSWE